MGRKRRIVESMKIGPPMSFDDERLAQLTAIEQAMAEIKTQLHMDRRRLAKDEDKVTVADRVRFYEIMNKPKFTRKERNPIPSIDSSSEEPPMRKPAMKYRPKEVSKCSVSRRLVEDEDKVTVADRVRFYESMNKPKFTRKERNPIPSIDSSSEEPPMRKPAM